MTKSAARAAKRKHAKALKRVDRARPARPVQAPPIVPMALRDRHAHRRVREEAYWAAFKDLSTDEICEYAERHLGVRWTEESFRALAEGAVSSWELALDKCGSRAHVDTEIATTWTPRSRPRGQRDRDHVDSETATTWTPRSRGRGHRDRDDVDTETAVASARGCAGVCRRDVTP